MVKEEAPTHLVNEADLSQGQYSLVVDYVLAFDRTGRRPFRSRQAMLTELAEAYPPTTIGDADSRLERELTVIRGVIQQALKNPDLERPMVDKLLTQLMTLEVLAGKSATEIVHLISLESWDQLGRPHKQISEQWLRPSVGSPSMLPVPYPTARLTQAKDRVAQPVDGVKPPRTLHRPVDWAVDEYGQPRDDFRPNDNRSKIIYLVDRRRRRRV